MCRSKAEDAQGDYAGSQAASSTSSTAPMDSSSRLNLLFRELDDDLDAEDDGKPVQSRRVLRSDEFGRDLSRSSQRTLTNTILNPNAGFILYCLQHQYL